jgi:DNA-binding XRE family transcriptional regulator
VSYINSMKNKLAVYRQKLNMNQTEFAALLGVHRVTLNRWERQREQPSLESLLNIWDILNPLLDGGINLQDLVER